MVMTMVIVWSTTCDDLLRTNCNHTSDSQTLIYHHIVGIMSNTYLSHKIHTKEINFPDHTA